MSKPISISAENFLKTVFSLQDEEHGASSGALSNRLGISRAAITDMAKKLSNEGWVVYDPYKPLTLTPEGKVKAVAVIRRHRLWETFLHDVLGLAWDEVHPEAEQLEHQTSETLINRIEEYLGHPEVNPHGDPIPDRMGIFPEPEGILALSEARKTGEYEIVRMGEHEGETADFFGRYNMLPGEQITLSGLMHGGVVEVMMGSATIVMPKEFAKKLIVKEI